MGQNSFFNEALSEWMKGSGPESDIVISSRIRLARNLQSIPFPILASDQHSMETLNRVKVLLYSEDLNEISTFEMLLLDDLNELSKKVLVEKHLISPALANESKHGAVILSENESISICLLYTSDAADE